MTRIVRVCNNTLSCEPFVRRMPNGELLVVAQCDGTGEPQPENRVYFFHSTDNGETWSKRQLLYPEEGKAVYCTEVMVIGNEITAFLTVHSGGFLWWKCVMMKSHDNGHTWENAGSPPYFPEYTFIRSKIETSDGSIIIPYQHYPITREDYDNALAKHGPNAIIVVTAPKNCETGVLISHDGGKSYEKHIAGMIEPLECGWAWTEPTLAELSDGTLSMLIRIDTSGYLWRCDSHDGGVTWSKVYNTQIPNPSNKPRLINLDRNHIALIHTPNKGPHRGPYELWISKDDMKTWYIKERITDFPGAYHYTDGFYEDGHILFTVEHNRHTVLFFDYTVKK